MEGLESADYNNESVFHISLTTDNDVLLDIHESFCKLLNEIYKVYKHFRFCYVITDEGNGVIHLLLNDVFLPVEWFSNFWSKFHNSYIVRRFLVDFSRIVDLSVYLSTQDCIVDLGCSCDWLNILGSEMNVVDVADVSFAFKSSVDGFNRRLF